MESEQLSSVYRDGAWPAIQRQVDSWVHRMVEGGFRGGRPIGGGESSYESTWGFSRRLLGRRRMFRAVVWSRGRRFGGWWALVIAAGALASRGVSPGTAAPGGRHAS